MPERKKELETKQVESKMHKEEELKDMINQVEGVRGKLYDAICRTSGDPRVRANHERLGLVHAVLTSVLNGLPLIMTLEEDAAGSKRVLMIKQDKVIEEPIIWLGPRPFYSNILNILNRSEGVGLED